MSKKTPSSAPSRLKYYLEIAMLAALLPLFALGVTWLLRQKFNDDFWRRYLEEKISAVVSTDCRIESFRFQPFNGELQIHNLRMTARNPDHTSAILAVAKINVQIDWWKTLTKRGLVGDAKIENWNWIFARRPRFLPSASADNSSEESPITINNSTPNLSSPHSPVDASDWQQTLRRWRNSLMEKHPQVIAYLNRMLNFRIEVTGGEIVWRDLNGNLSDSVLQMPLFSAEVSNGKITANSVARLKTDELPDGGEIKFSLLADTPDFFSSATAPLRAEVSFTELDLPTLSLYYDFGYDFREQRFTLGAPFTGDFTLTGTWLPRNIQASFNLQNPRLLRVYPAIDSDAPMPELTAEGSLKIGESSGWELDKLALCVGKRESAWLRLDAIGAHRDGKGLDLQLDLTNSFADFSQSELAKRLQLQLRGKTNLSLRAQTVTEDQESLEQVEVEFTAKDLRAEVTDALSRVQGSLASANAKILIAHSWSRGAEIKNIVLNTGAFEIYSANRRDGSDVRLRIDAASFNAEQATALIRNLELAQPALFPIPDVIIPLITVRTLHEPPFAVSYVLFEKMLVNYQQSSVENSPISALKKGFFQHLPATKPYVTKLVRRAAAEKVRDAVASVVQMVITNAAIAPPVPLHLSGSEIKLLTPGEYGDGMRFPLDLLVDGITSINADELADRIEQAMR